MFIANEKTRLNWVDNSKGIGIILVVLGHVLRGLDAAKIEVPFFEIIDRFIYAFHMPLFFFLSGYLFLNTYLKGFGEFVNSRFSTLLYPYLLWSFIQVLIQYIMSSYINGDVSVNDLLTFFLPRSQFWFLLALLAYNIFNYFVYSKIGLYGIILVSILLVMSATFYRFDGHLVSLIIINTLFFNLGILFFNFKIGNYFFGKHSLFFLVSSFFFFLFFFHFFYFMVSSSVVLKYILGGLGILMVIIFGFLISDKFNLLAYLGKNSIVIYLLHILCGSGSRIFLTLMGIVNPYIHVLCGLFIGIFLPILIYEFLDKNKIQFLFLSKIKLIK